MTSRDLVEWVWFPSGWAERALSMAKDKARQARGRRREASGIGPAGEGTTDLRGA